MADRLHEAELLPARDADIGMTAVDHGADAVSIGGRDFGARVKAGNSVACICPAPRLRRALKRGRFAALGRCQR